MNYSTINYYSYNIDNNNYNNIFNNISPVSIDVVETLIPEQIVIDEEINLAEIFQQPRNRNGNGKLDISIIMDTKEEETKEEETKEEETKEEETKEEIEDFECPICFELTKKENKTILNCKHSFCIQCIQKTLTNGSIHCALCRTNITSIAVNSKESLDLISSHCK